MKAYTGYMSVKFTKCLYLVNVGNSPEVRLWESACNLLLQRPPAPWLASCQTVAREQTRRSKGISAATVEEEEKKKQTTNYSAIVLEQLNQEVLIGKTKGHGLLVG